MQVRVRLDGTRDKFYVLLVKVSALQYTFFVDRGVQDNVVNIRSRAGSGAPLEVKKLYWLS